MARVIIPTPSEWIKIMSVTLDVHGFRELWQDITLDKYEGYYPNMTDYHMHEYYEISLIISGNVNVLLKDKAVSSQTAKLVLLPPLAPHYIYCEPDLLYSRRNVLFSGEFLRDNPNEWKMLSRIFGKNGVVLTIEEGQCETYLALVKQIEKEENLFRRRLLLLLFLSLISDNMQEQGVAFDIPEFVTEALSIISTGFKERIVAEDLAKRLKVGRTTLMTGFKKYTGTTLNEYLLRCRLKAAVEMLQNGKNEQQTAEECGFGDACNLIRCFKRQFSKTPKQYIKSIM